MGLTSSATGLNAVDSGLTIKKQTPDDKVIALAGNPNVGKSTVFNGLTGMHQHTGNWPGKTVASAQGFCRSEKYSYVLVDIPGTYSLMAHSAEEEVARNFICFGDADGAVVVCDATCLERNLNLVLQIMEITDKVTVCVNLMDEAKRKGMTVDLDLLRSRLQVPVVGTVGRSRKSLDRLLKTVDEMLSDDYRPETAPVIYAPAVELAISAVQPELEKAVGKRINCRWLSLKLLEGDKALIKEANAYLETDIMENEAVKNAVLKGINILKENGIDEEKFKDSVVSSVVKTGEKLCMGVVEYKNSGYNDADRKIDRILTSRWGGYPAMLMLLAMIFWITIAGANYPSELLSSALFYLQDRLTDLFEYLKAPSWLHGAVVMGMYRVLAWVVSVMLPPMAIFFPLFTLLEDSGYLPRIAYNLDRPFKKCSACGKQALTMAMGFGCNAAGVVGCRIIDSPRERLLAILTNNFVPCNGRFPTIISILTMFFVGSVGGFLSGGASALLLTFVILMGIGMTFAATKILSKTVLKGVPSSFTLELPPYRRPQIGKVIVRSIFDRTLFVLGRAATVAVPAGLIIWITANVKIGDVSILNHAASFLDPFAKIMGLDGVLLMAFVLGFPANEIVIPIAIMAYTAKGSLPDVGSLEAVKTLFVENGWTWITAVNMIMFSLFHWPCSTTLLTVKKETGSVKWTLAAFAIPTAVGIVLCTVFTAAVRIIINAF